METSTENIETNEISATSEDVGYDDVDLDSDASPMDGNPHHQSTTPAAAAAAAGQSFGEKLVSTVGRPLAAILSSTPTAKKQQQHDEKETIENAENEKPSTIPKNYPAITESTATANSTISESTTTTTENKEIDRESSSTTIDRNRTNDGGGDERIPTDGDTDRNRTEEVEEAARRILPAMSTDTERIAAVVAAESPDETFERLRQGIVNESISPKEVVNSVFQVLVGGPFDMENKFIIQDSSSVVRMVDLLDACTPKLQAEMWSVFIGIVRKSTKNLESCAEVDLIGLILMRLPKVDDIVADFFIELLGVLASNSVDVKQMKQFLRSLEATDGKWTRNSAKLLYVLKQMPKKEGPDIFFSFSGGKKAGIQIPPLTKWPYQNGWTFCTWLRMDPMNAGIFEREMPYLYSFRTSKSLGYSCHFVGNCLVLTAVKTKAGKGYQLCVKYELQPRKWHHLAMVHVYSRWGRNEVQCYIDGQHITTLDMNWHIGVNEHFDRCYIGYSPEDDRLSSFCGQLGAVYLFGETLNLQQINSIYCLGPGYQSCFKFENEAELPAGYLKYLFDGRLASSIVFAYCPKNCDRQLCLESSPKENPTYFVHTPHALMMEGVNVVVTHSVHTTLHSVGGIQVLLPLFGQLDMPQVKSDGSETLDYTICSTLLSVVAQLTESSPGIQQQLLQTKGFLVIGNMLLKASKEHISDRVLETLLDMTNSLLSTSACAPLLKLLVDHILINPGLWIHTAPKLQLRLYNYLSSDFVSNAQFYNSIRRVSTVMQMLHALKYYYWLVDPRNKSGYQPKGLDGPRPNTQEIVKIRAHLLLFIRKLMMKGDGSSKDDELQALLNYVTTVHEDDNLYDVLETHIILMSDDPATMVPAFDKKKGICAIFKLLASPNELIRLPALKLFGYFLCRSTSKRKLDVMTPNNLFTLLTERLLLHASHITMAKYNVLFEILMENMTSEIVYGKHPEAEGFLRFENPMILKVIANLISQSKPCAEVMEVKKMFLNDIMTLCANSRENRRTILQMSVWQEWLISLAHIYPKNDEEAYISNLVCQTFCMLLHHAIKLEYGGWRVWVDTLAIVHSKVSFEKFKIDVMDSEHNAAEQSDRRRTMRETASISPRDPSETTTTSKGGDNIESEVTKLVSSMVDTICDELKIGGGGNEYQRQQSKETSTVAKPIKRQEFRPSATPKPVYRTPEFRWSHIHIKLLSDLLLLIESDVATWKNNPTKNVIDFVNSSENAVFVVNTVHMISQIVDNLIMACGGLLPLLAAATSPNSELEIADTTQQSLRIEIAVTFLIRFANLCDVMVFATALNFSELEQEKNMPAGGILRQCLRLVATVAVRNCLAARAKSDSASPFMNMMKNDQNVAKERAIMALIAGVTDDESLKDIVKQAMEVQDPEQLLQEVDLNRLKAVIYRDIEETRQAQFLALGVVYFLSVLMVSRYRDILEPPPSPSPFFNTSKVLPSAEVVSAGRLSVEAAAANGLDDKDRTHADTKSISSVGSGISKESGVASSHDRQSVQGELPERRSPVNGSESAATAESNEAGGGGDADAQSATADDGRPDREPSGAPISSIQLNKNDGEGDGGTSSTNAEKYKPEQLRIEPVNVSIPRERQATLTTKLKKALESTSPLLREIMTDFHSFLQRTLLGTHGQEIMNDTKVLATLRNQQGSVVELVMLLCSQEWQTSLQKHAGLAFIELVNEGRLLAHATRDHIVRVANEADFILNRLRAEDVGKHAEFETICAQTAMTRKEEEKTCDLLITAARRRDCIVAGRVNDKILNILCSEHGAWSSSVKRRQFWKLDVWEDDSRRRKRLVPNVYGSAHPEATLRNGNENGTNEHELEKDRDALSTHLAGKGIVSPSSVAVSTAEELVDDIDISKAANEDKDLEAEANEAANYTTTCKLIAPGVSLSGLMSITSNEMFFDCNEDDPEFRQQDPRVIRYCETLHGRWHFNEIRAIFLRRYMLQNQALEIFLAARTAVMFAFPDHATVKKVVQFLPRVGVGVKYGLPQSRRASLMSARQLFKHSEMPQKWQRREISNFDYLMFLNTIAGRTYNDLNQYPVFPWILSNYEADELDLKQAANFRDLSKPIAALNDVRQAYFNERYNSWEHDKIPPFHCGTHYSTAAFVMHWLVRVEPFSTMFLNLQGNKFDAADRTFHSISESWRSCLRDTHDVKELIPEFYYLPEMFVNMNAYQFGKRDDGLTVNDIVLPKWAKSPEHFVSVHRQALESDLVSCQLHQWIDLIFGYKQRGPEAVRATNVFYYLTYEGAVDLNTLLDPVMKQAFENQIKNFGQTPSHLLTEPHPPRQSVMTISPLMFQPIAEDLCMVMKFISNSPVVHLSANTYPQLANPTVLSITGSLGYSLNRWNNNYTGPVVAPSFSTPTVTEKADPQGQVPNLPLTVDPLLASGNPSVPVARRHLGDMFDQRLQVKWNNFITTVDSKFIIACGYPDNSLRVIETESARVRQVVYGHKAVVTCVARSECNLSSDCYLASGSRDCTVLLWHWSARTQTIAGESGTSGEAATPRAVLTGHDTEIVCIVVSAEHGLVVSCSNDGPILVHTTNGDLLRCLEPPDPSLRSPKILLMSRDCYLVSVYDRGSLCVFTTSGRPMKFVHTDQQIGCLCLTRDGEYLVAAGDSGVISLYRLFDLAHLYSYPPCDGAVKSLALAQNHRFILAGLSSGAIVVFNVDFNKWHHEYQQRYQKI